MAKTIRAIRHEERVFPKILRQSCPCCQSKDFAIIHRGHDDRLGYPDTFAVAACRVCSYSFIHDPVDVEMVGALYAHYYPECPLTEEPPSSRYGLRTRLESARWFHVLEGSPDLSRFIRAGESVLDVGCSYGASADVAAHRGAAWTGVEVDPKCCEHLQARNLAVYNGTIEQLAQASEQRFDTVMFSQVLEHVYQPIQVLRAARRLLRDSGRILISMPNWDSRYRQQYGALWLHWHLPYHVGHWSRQSLSVACWRSDLSIRQFATRTFFAWWRVQRHLRAVALGEPNPSYPGGALPRWARRSGLAVVFHLFVDLYLRAADLRGDGDVIVAELRPSGDHPVKKEIATPVAK